jgi:hypothetical protein
MPALLALACSAPETGGSRIEVATRIQGEAAARDGFENAFGWRIELSVARVAFAHLYYVTGESVGSLGAWNPFVAVAHAHPGHYDAGEVLAEMGGHAVVDLLGGPESLGAREGVTGAVRSAVVTFGTLSSANSDAGADANVLELEGVARSNASTVQFEASVAANDLLHVASDLPEVEGCPFVGELATSGTVTCEVLVSVWLDQVDFAGFEPDQETRVELERGSEAHNALSRGVRKAVAYSFSFESENR